ncbi:MAG: peptidoglycan bridge formation glycyltransferase FemA/FemB family protein [bacterium]|nr:peptidoglycan bridge formation glycyltransferase FemA/FemB family protein [bacterium]
MESIGWIVENYSNGQAFIRKIPFLGSVIKVQQPNLPIPLNELDKIAKKHHAVFLKLEPFAQPDTEIAQEIIKGGYKPDNFPLIPTKTIKINLLPTSDILFSNLEKDTRNCVRKTIKNELKVLNSIIDTQTVSNEIFVDAWQKNAKEKKFAGAQNKEIANLYTSFQSNHNSALIFVTDSQNNPLAGSLLLYSPQSKTTHYMHAFSTQEGRKSYAPYRLVWESILFAKNNWISDWFDLEGVHDPRYPKSTSQWKGFTHFKKGFGGTEFDYIGSFTKYYNPLFKLLSNLE